jgi:hypothetical protein
MPEHASRFAGLYDQQNENRIADWGGDELFTRMPTPRAVDDAPAPRFRPSLALVDAPEDRRRNPPGDAWSGRRDRRRARSAEQAMIDRAERLGLSVVEEGRPAGWDAAEWAAATRDDRADEPTSTAATAAIVRGWAAEADAGQWDAIMEPPDERAPNGRRTKVITGRPGGSPRPLSVGAAERCRPARTPAEWIGPRPDRIVAWAFVLGLLLILVAISTADAATL